MPDERSRIAGDLSPPIGGAVSDATDGPPDDGGSVVPTGSGWFSPLRIVIAVVLVAATLIPWQSTGGSSPLYRTTTVGTGTVEATLDTVGTITPANQASLNFNVSGTVSAVDVSVGQTVSAGQTLASLNIADLNATVASAQASLAAAQATLASAETSQTEEEEVSASSSATPTSSSVPATSTTTTTAPASDAGSSSAAAITQLQATLVSDQMQLDADSSQAGSTLARATTVCAAPAPPATPSSPTTTSTTTTTDPSPGGAPATCAEALSQASAAQAKVAADIKTVSQDERALTSALEASSGSGAGSSSPGSPSGTGKTGATSGSAASTSSVGTASTTSGTAGAGTGAPTVGSTPKASKVATPQQLAVDQASIDTAEANLADAQQALSGVNLVSTISGTVASVSLGNGDSVTAGSSSDPAQIVVIGTGTSYDVSTDVSVADIGKVSIGQPVEVTPDATNTAVNGQVSSIGVLASSGSTTTTYPVTISLDTPGLGQLSGADANLSIVVKKSVDVTTVPSSAVRTVGSIHLVTVVHNTTAKSVRVTLGTVGDVLTQVTSGVSPGQSVALADLNEPLPSTSTATTRTGFGGGGLGGAGFGGGAGLGGGGGLGATRFAG